MPTHSRLARYLSRAAAAAVPWTLAEWIGKGKPAMLGAASGTVAGLVAITPACGTVGIVGGIVIGLAAGVVCRWGVTGLKHLLRADDSLDVFGVHGVGGILGALLTGVFTAPGLGGTGGADFAIVHQVGVRAMAVGITIAWSSPVAFVACKAVDLAFGLRASEEHEREGLGVSSHGERAYAS